MAVPGLSFWRTTPSSCLSARAHETTKLCFHTPRADGEDQALFHRDDGDLSPEKHIQAIANSAGFHFGFIEQGGSSLYPALAQRVRNPEVLRILLSIGPSETAHFQIWHDNAGDAPALTDPTNGLVFPNLNAPPFGGEDFQTNLIMPEPTVFLKRKFPVCSIIRPTETKGAAMGTLKALIVDGLFIGQPQELFSVLGKLAQDADAARRQYYSFKHAGWPLPRARTGTWQYSPNVGEEVFSEVRTRLGSVASCYRWKGLPRNGKRAEGGNALCPTTLCC